VCQKSSLKPFGHNTPTLQTDGRISYGIGLDLTVGQKYSHFTVTKMITQ